MKRVLFACLISLNAVGQSNDDLVKVRAPKVDAQVGHDALVTIFVIIKNGYHIQAHEATDELIIPTTLEIADSQNLIVNNQVFPPAKKFMLTGTGTPMEVYDGEFAIQASLNVSRQIQKGIYQLNAKLKYQACDSVRCLFPRTVEFLMNVEVQ